MDLNLGAQRIRGLAKVRGVSVNKMLVSELGLSKSVVDHMAEGSVPSADKLVLIAQYLDTSVAYIIGMTDDEKPTTPGQGQSVRMELRAMIAGIPDDKLGRVKGILQAAIDAVK